MKSYEGSTDRRSAGAGEVVRSTKPRYDPKTGERTNKGEKLIKTDDGWEATRDQGIIHDARTTNPENVVIP